MSDESKTVPAGASASGFVTTHWSLVLQAGDGGSPQAEAALEQLCRTYWHPLYVYVRRHGYSPEDAQDLTQQFFAFFLEKGGFAHADPARGRLRTFLLHALQYFLINEWKRAQRLKRGGGRRCLSLDAGEAEAHYLRGAAETLTPERAYEQRWAMALLDQALAGLQQEYAQAGQSRLFEELADLLWGKEPAVTYAEIGGRLGLTDGATRAAMHRLRRRYRERLRSEVAHTVEEPTEVEEELRYLLMVVRRRE
jgi:RNA polymerase sigma factor (sigma-70 family)